jgi:DNA-binding transcriptional ArsR family regulator
MTSQDNDAGKLLPQPSFPTNRTAGWSMLDVLRALANGEITSEQALAQLMALHEVGEGAIVKALEHLDPALAQQFAERAGTNLVGSAQRLSKTSVAVEGPAQEQASTERFRNKSPLVLQREYLLFKALTKSNQEVPSAYLLQLVTSFDPDIKGPAVTAHLDRLFKDGLISRRRKGLYGTTLQSRGYLKALITELEARGVSLPPE